MEMKKEMLRKTIHFLGIFYLPLYVYMGKAITLEVIGFLLLISFLIEALRRKYRLLPEWILNPYEIKGIGAYVYFGVAAFLLTALLSAEAAIVGVLIGSVGDGVSGLIKAYQKNQKKLAKSGFRAIKIPFISMVLFSFVSLLIVSVFVTNLKIELDFDLRIIALACLIGAFIESKPIKIGDFYVNDNLSVPLFSGIFYQLFSYSP